jgi:hypothetical protein
LSIRDLHQRCLRHLGDDPDAGQIGDAEECFSRLCLHAFNRHALEDHTRARGHDRNTDSRSALFRDTVDHLIRNAEVFQPLTAPRPLVASRPKVGHKLRNRLNDFG